MVSANKVWNQIKKVKCAAATQLKGDGDMKKIFMSNKKIQDFEFALLSLDLIFVQYFLTILYFFLF